ncbi:MAG: phosphoethanolamine transferase [Proteus mirabilis]|nr:phosphoethanolamine transferase [Proteus mirabilis]
MTNINRYKLKQIFFSLVAFVVLFLTVKLMLKGVGIPNSARQTFLLVILIIFLSSSRKLFWFLVFPMCLVYAIYSPIGSVFGKPTYQYVASVFATDLLESKDFFSQIPLTNYTYPFLIIMGILIYHFLVLRYKVKIYKNKTIVSIMIVFSMVNQTPAVFFKSIINSSYEVINEMSKLNELKKDSNWKAVSSFNPQYNTYVLIIGESARRDYHHAYGYPINNTPFMSSSKGVLIDGLASGGTNTISSLRLMLTKPNTTNWEPDYSLNFIDLAKSSGIKTYWLSNQGFLGDSDTPISAIASKSDSKFFTKSGGYNSNNTSDFALIKKVEDVVKEHNDEHKLIVIHLYGSHTGACQRIDDYKKIVDIKDKKYLYINCYISSINKTDDIIRKINSIMEERFLDKKESYSMIYFADHGLNHNIESDGMIILNNRGISKFHYNIPLFKVSSDDTERLQCKSFKSGLNFVNGIASWMGIENEQLDKNYSLFDCKNDVSDFGLQNRIDRDSKAPDPAIDLTGR